MMEVEKLKGLLGISDGAQDIALGFILSDVEETIKNYCNVEQMPEGLLHTAYRMAMDLYRNENIGRQERGAGPVSSITIGDTSTSFRQCAEDGFKDTLLKNYMPLLNRYRKVGFL